MATQTTTTSTATSTVILQIPPAGQTIIVELQPNQIVEVPFDLAEANITLVGNDLRLEFPGDAVLILTDFATIVDAGTSPVLMFADGSVVAGDVILTALSAEVPETAAGAGAGGSGGAGEYEDDMGALLGGVTRLGPQNPDPFAKTVEMSLLDEQPPLLPEVPAPVNNPPIAEDNVYRLTAGQLKAILASEGIFSNDFDPDGDPITFTRADNPPNVTINTTDGSLTIDATTVSELYSAYQALDEGETLSFTFPYTIADPAGLTATANVTIIVEGVNDPPTIITDPGNPEGASDVVYEAGLPAGSGNGPTAVTAEGTFKVADPDGLDDIVSVTINGTVIAIANLGNNNLIAGTYGNLTITGYDPATGEGTYQYELTQTTTDGAGGEVDVFTLTTSDGTVSSGPATITIEIVDDLPAAVNDVPAALVEDGLSMVSGNVLANDLSGADAPASFVAWDVAANAAAMTELAKYGTLTLNTDGSYEFVLNNALAAVQALAQGQTISQALAYTMQDADGDPSTAILTLTINGADDSAEVTVAAEGADSTVYEAGLDAFGSAAATASETDADSFDVYASDGIKSVTVGGTTFTVAELAGFTPSAPSAPIDTGEGWLVITGYSSADGKTATVSYEYTLKAALEHTQPGADQLTDSVAVAVAGIGGTLASANLTIAIVDDLPVVSFSNSLGPASATVFTGTWLAQTGADVLPSLDYVRSVALNSAKVNDITATNLQLGEGSYDLNGNLAYAGAFTYEGDKEVGFTLTLKTDGTYAVELAAVPTQITIDPSEYAGAVKASGPTDTYILSYHDVETGQVVTATTSVAKEGLSVPLIGIVDADGTPTQLFDVTTVGKEVNPSGDGIGIENNIINSYVSNTGALTTESLTFDPTGAADTITLNFKASGAPGFGQSGSEDVLYVKVFSTDGSEAPHMIMLDSRYGDFVIDGSTATAIAGGYGGGGLDAYTISNPFASGAIDSIEVTGGFYTYEQGQKTVVGTTEVKIAFGFTTETTTVVNLPVEMNFTTTVEDADGDSGLASFTVYSIAGHEFMGTDGDDMIPGTDGNDILTGGAGGDIFAYSANGGEGLDTIKDFSLAGGDVLRFHDVLDGLDDGSDLGATDVNASVFAAGDDITITINGTTQVVLEGLNTQIGLSDGAHTLADLPSSMLDFTPDPHTI